MNAQQRFFLDSFNGFWCLVLEDRPVKGVVEYSVFDHPSTGLSTCTSERTQVRRAVAKEPRLSTKLLKF